MLVLVVVILGSFTIMTLARMNYIEALAATVMLVGGAVLLVALAWNPRTGFAGLNVFFSRYLFSIGLPMERWLHFLAELSQLETRPERFLSEAVAALARLPWISGLVWRADGAGGEQSAPRPPPVGVANSRAPPANHSPLPPAPAPHWHLHL